MTTEVGGEVGLEVGGEVDGEATPTYLLFLYTKAFPTIQVDVSLKMGKKSFIIRRYAN